MVRSRASAPNFLRVFLLPFWLLRWNDEYYDKLWCRLWVVVLIIVDNLVKFLPREFNVVNFQFAHIVCKCFIGWNCWKRSPQTIEMFWRAKINRWFFPFKVFEMRWWLEVQRISPKYRFFHFTWWNRYSDCVVFIGGCGSTSNAFHRRIYDIQLTTQKLHYFENQSDWNFA